MINFKHTILGLLSLLIWVTPSYGDNTIEVFLKHDMELTGAQSLRDQGYRITYYYFDDIERIEDNMSQRASKKLQSEIDAVVKELGVKKLMILGEFERNQLLLKQMESSGISLQQIRHTLVTPKDREDINQALQILIYASDQGVTEEMLPAIIFNKNLYPKTTDLSNILKLRQSN